MPPSVDLSTLLFYFLQRICSSLGLPNGTVHDHCAKLRDSPWVQPTNSSNDSQDNNKSDKILGADTNTDVDEEEVDRVAGEDGDIVRGHSTFGTKPAPYSTPE